MNKKQVGSALRHGIAAGTVAGFFAGWLSFTAHSKQLDAIEMLANETVNSEQANLLGIPPVPALPKLGGLPAPANFRVSTGPAMPALIPPSAAGSGSAAAPAVPAAPAPQAPVVNQPAPAPVMAPAPAPVFAPIPTLPPAPPRPVATTKPSGG